ncbi:hypothetical protein C8D78_0484 [Arthrobacter oryzae]|uniref:Uncharacterized protein n=1 Tax=Arthrobacter oryzae TaxID=409290 RepID=A0A495FLP0_9MICC|nr:hypothetical protein C8D78_0484 [Arthrobacter oryzae]
MGETRKKDTADHANAHWLRYDDYPGPQSFDFPDMDQDRDEETQLQ